MSGTERHVRTLERIRWLAFVPATVMYVGTVGAFGSIPAAVLSVIAMACFFLVCNSGKKRMLWDHIVSDICDGLEKVGHKEAVFELKSLSVGIVVRVYLIRARQKTAFCKKAIEERVLNGWYNDYVCVTQVVDLSNEGDIKVAQEELDAALVKELKENVLKRR